MIKSGPLTFNNFVLTLLSLVCVLLAVNAYKAFEFKQSSAADDFFNKPWASDDYFDSVLIHPQRIRQPQIASQIQELEAPLAFMVWPQERKNLSKLWQDALREQINQTPFKAQAWRQLSFAEYYLQTAPENRVWAITVGATLAWWHTSERLLFVRHCVLEYEVFKSLMPVLCDRLIASLPANASMQRLAQGMGVKVKYLQWLLLQNKENIESN